MMSRFPLLAALLLGLCGTAPLHAQEAEVRAAALRFVVAFNNLDWPAFEASFDTGATIFHPMDGFASRIEGRASVVESFEQIFGAVPAARPGPPYLSIRPQDLHVQLLGEGAAVVTFHLPQENALGRRTLAFVRRGERWLISHLHASFLPAPPLSAQSVPQPGFAERIDAIFAEYDRSDAPGCAVGVSRDGEIVFARGYGLANVENGVPITPQTTFGVGSIIKHLTALAALMLEEWGVLAMEDEVRSYIPELPDYGTPITIQDLLQHTSGLRDYGTLGTLRGRPVATMDDFLDLMVRQQGLNYMPGERHAYSHSDYELLGLVIERAVREPFGPFLEREVLRPLGMSDSRVHDHRAAPIPNRAFGHRTAADGYAVAFPGHQLVGGVGLYTTVEDLLRWERHFHAGTPERQLLADRLLERPALRSGEMIPYAYGLKHGAYRGLPTVNRSAGGSFATEFMRFPEQRLAVVTLCNVLPSHPLYLSREVAEVFLEELMEPVAAGSTPVTVQAPVDELARYSGTYRPLVDRWNLLTLVVQDDALAEVVGNEAVLLDRHNDGRYETSGVFFTFTPPAGNGPLRLALSVDGALVEELERVAETELWRPDAASLAEFAGSYLSPDLDVTWTLAIEGNDLVVQRRRGERERLTPAGADVFMRAFGSYERPVYAGLTFARDASGRITHFVLSTPAGEDAAQGLVFGRVETGYQR
jgi:CubicO group peptidase (beta-lactamase class C family)